MYETPKRILFLLTVWQERPASPGRPAVWRYSLEDTGTGERRGFCSPEELVAYLRAQTRWDEAQGDQPRSSE